MEIARGGTASRSLLSRRHRRVLRRSFRIESSCNPVAISSTLPVSAQPNSIEIKKMTKLRYFLVPLALSFATSGVRADDAVEKAVDYRQGVMNVYAFNVTSMGDMVKGEANFDAAAFARHAKDLASAARLDVLAGFPEDSINDESDASDTIWLDWDKFQEKHKALQEQSGALDEVAAGGDEAAMKEQFGKTARTCKGCHDDFKN
jgi:cytochrome c556